MKAVLPRFIFTVCAGRSGQFSLASIVNKSCPGTLALVESPSAETVFDGRVGKIELKLRRQFFATHELLGRGKILKAFEERDDEYISSIAIRRIEMATKCCADQGRTIYFDVSKFFARGLHVGFCKLVPRFSLVLLVRDPVLNMRSFMNRNKNFFLDNNQPDAERNILKMSPSDLLKEEL